MQAGEPQSGIPLYAEYAKEEVAAQDLRKTSFEQRAITVITTSGALVTLLFGLAALSTKEAQTFVLPQGARDSLGKALVLFVSAAALALLTNLPLKYEAVKPDDIKNRLEEGTPRDQDAAAKDIALTRIKVLKDAKTKNTIKGLLVLAALLIEVVAVGFVADGVHQVITG